MMKKLAWVMLAALPVVTSLHAESVLCPTPEFVVKAAQYVDTVVPVTPGSYAVYTSQKIYDTQSHRYWSVGNDVRADNPDKALEIGRQNIANVTYVAEKYADNFQTYWGCFYGDPQKLAVYVTTAV